MAHFHAFVFAGVMHDLGTLGGAFSYALGINASGQVAGYSRTSHGLDIHAFITDGNGLMDLGTIGGENSLGYAINNRGQVTGFSNTASNAAVHAFLYSNGSMTDLGTLPGGKFSIGYGMNNLGDVVGYADSSISSERCFLYTAATGMQDIGTLGGSGGIARAVNDLDEVVGSSALAGDTVGHAFLFKDGRMLDLNKLIPPGSGWVLTDANAINNLGQIVGVGESPNSLDHAYLLTPVPEPASLVLLGIGLLALVLAPGAGRIISCTTISARSRYSLTSPVTRSRQAMAGSLVLHFPVSTAPRVALFEFTMASDEVVPAVMVW